MAALETLKNEAAARGDRVAAAKALASASNQPGALDALCAVLDTRDEELRETARLSLSALGGAGVLTKRATDGQVAEGARVLALTGLRYFRDDVEATTLRALLKDSSVAVRAQAALALAVMGPAKAEVALLEALGDSDAKVRFYAADGLASATSAAAKQAVLKRLETETDATVRFALIAARNRQSS
jgi:quinoprotein glucose dehydrogenase